MQRIINLLLLITLIYPAITFADGKVYSKPSIKPPNIPSQRAIMTYRDGTETLIIESALDGPGKEFGWIIPLPAPPTEFKPVSPGLIKTFSRTIQPKIITSPRSQQLAFILLLPELMLTELFLFWFLAIFLFKTKPAHAFAIGFVIWILFSIFIPQYSNAGIGGGPTLDGGVKILGQQQVGSYNLTTLQAEKPHALDQWLTSNGFTGLDEKDTQIVSDYIDQNWCFVASRLIRDKDGFSLPHPLSMKFLTEEPVYPMRLTSTTGNDLYFELFIVADKKAAANNLTLQFADKFIYETNGGEKINSRSVKLTQPAFFSSQDDTVALAHPQTLNLLWDGCFLSRFNATLTPQQMQQDITPTFVDRQPYRKTYYSKETAKKISFNWARIAAALLLGLASIKYHKKIVAPKGRIFALKSLVLPTILISAVTASIAYQTYDVVEVRHDAFGGPRSFNSLESFAHSHIGLLKSQDKIQEGMNLEQIKSVIAELYEQRKHVNVYTEEKIQYGDSPGDYQIVKDERTIKMIIYTENGFIVEISILEK